VGTDPERVYGEACALLRDPERYARMSTAANPFGDGTAGEQIVRVLADVLG